MRVLLIANTLPPHDLSGAGEQVVQLAWGLRQRGHEVEILGRRASPLAGRKELFPLWAPWAVWRTVRRFRPHVVQVHESDGGLAALAVAVLAPVLDPSPVLVALLQVSYRREMRAVRKLRDRSAEGQTVLGRPSAAEYRFRYCKGPLQVTLGWLSAWLADHVLAPSARTAAEIESDYGIGPIHVLPNVTRAPSSPRRQEVDRETDEPYFLYLGRLRIRKGVEVLLRAMLRLRAQGPIPRLLIAGDGERRVILEEHSRRLGLSREVVFLGRCDLAQVQALLSRALALVVPSLYEGMPLVILEAMLAEVAVVASRVSGIPEVVLDPETGWLVAPEDSRSLAAALAQVLAEPDEARRRGREGRHRVLQHFRPEDAAQLWERMVLGH